VSALVTLNVYDLGTSGAVRALNRVLRDFGSGAFHCGVEVLGHEWSYGHCGIVSSPPRDCMGHNFSEAVTMGMTNLALKDICKMVRMLEKDWSASKYDIMTHNCCHFGNQLCLDLGVGSVPSWVMRLANTGSSVSSMAGLMTAGLRPCCCVPSQAHRLVETSASRCSALRPRSGLMRDLSQKSVGSVWLSPRISQSRSSRKRPPASARVWQVPFLQSRTPCQTSAAAERQGGKTSGFSWEPIPRRTRMHDVDDPVWRFAYTREFEARP